LVHEATESAYQKLADHLSLLSFPLYYLPGNHDNPDMMNAIMTANGHHTVKFIKAGQWQIILLESTLIGEHRGELSNAELRFLHDTLEKNASEHCLIAVHHHPVFIDSPWMDEMVLTNAEDFLNIVDDFNNIRGIIWGHIHQEFELERKGVSLLGTPSTCLQFKPKSDAFALDKKSPAYRKLKLESNGTLNTSVVYLTA